MSLETDPPPSQDYTPMEVSATPQKASWKSWKKKYEKMMMTFREKMKYSNSLFREEQKVLDISKRVNEENDRILDLILELNTCPHIAPSMRFDLRAAHAASRTVDPSTARYEVKSAQGALQEAKAELAAGELSPTSYRELEDSILQNSAFAPTLSLETLSHTVPHTTLSIARNEQSDGSSAELLSAYVTPGQEEEYLQELDAYIIGPETGLRPYPSTNGNKPGEKDRDAALRNPVSVYNWLRKHQPQVFLQDNEANPDKSASRAPAARASKRTPAQAKPEQEYDDDGILIEYTGTSRGKRKRDDDGGYRPKGGSSRPTKRKKDDGGSASKRGKKTSISEAAS